MFATCDTQGCTNAGHAIDVGDLSPTLDPATGETLPAPTVVCGVCGQPITDVI